jgi:opacity protein-like surface antigen
MFIRAISIAALAMLASSGARAQDLPLQPLRASAGLGLTYAQPVGEFADFIDRGFGLTGHFKLNLDRAGVIGLRADGGFVVYGSETKRVCFSSTVGCRIEVDVTTTNNIAYLNLGPEIAVPGGPVRPYANASIGFSYFATQSSLEGTNQNDDIASTTNFDDATFAYQLGGGLRIPVSSGRTPVAIDLGVRYNTNGRVEYLREGDIQDVEGGLILNTQRSEANLVTYVIGVTVGLRW